MEQEFYEEKINRFRVVKRDIDMSPSRQASMRLNGIDPATATSLVWSFETREDADRQCAADNENHIRFCKNYPCNPFYEYLVVDGGEAVTIKRPIGFF